KPSGNIAFVTHGLSTPGYDQSLEESIVSLYAHSLAGTVRRRLTAPPSTLMTHNFRLGRPSFQVTFPVLLSNSVFSLSAFDSAGHCGTLLSSPSTSARRRTASSPRTAARSGPRRCRFCVWRRRFLPASTSAAPSMYIDTLQTAARFPEINRAN